MKPNWNNIYLLGWHSSNGQRNLTSWSGKNKWIDVVVVGATDNDMSNLMWNNAIHKEFELIVIPPLTNCLWYAKNNSGLHGFGWYFENGINRPPMKPIYNEWAWLELIKGN